MAPDVSSGGFPCPPFSQARTRTGKSARTGPTEAHPQFCMVMQEFIDYMKFRMPMSFWLEEVRGFMLPLVALNGRSPCQVVAADLQTIGYSCQCLTLNHSAFLKNTRERVFLFGCRPEGGGMKGAEDIRDIILELMEHVEQFAKLRGGAFGV